MHGQRPRGEPVARGARRYALSARTVWKWWGRYRALGAAGLVDRSSRPHRLARQLPRARRRQIERARVRRWSSLRIAQHYQVPLSTVVTVQRRLGLNRLRRLEPPRPVVQYEKARPGELVHVDVKKLGRIGRIGHRIHGDRRRRVRGIGWEYVHVALDDCTRLGYAEVLPDELGPTTAAVLRRAVLWFEQHGVRVQALLSDNGGNHRSRVVATLFGYLRFYNRARRHTALQYQTPAQRLAERL